MQKLQALAGLGDALKTLGGLGDMLTEIKAGFTAAAVKMGIFTVSKEADTAATVVNTVATQAQGVAMTATATATTRATVATRLLKGALIASGIGAIIVLLGYAAESMGLFADETKDEEKAQKLLERQTKSLEKTIESYGRATAAVIQTIDNATRSELALARQRGASQKELTAITKAGAQDRLRAIEAETDGLRAEYLRQSKTASTENFAKIEKAYLDSVQKTKEAQITIQEIDADIAEAGRENVQNFAGTAVEITDLHDQIVDEQIKLIQDDDRRAQTQLIVESERRKRDVKNTVADKKQKAALIKAIEENLVIELDKLDKEYYEKKDAEEKERIEKEIADAEWLANYRKQLAEDERNANIKIGQDELAFEEKQNAAKLASLDGEQKTEYEKRLAFQKELNELNKLKQDGAFASQEDYDKAVALLDKKYFDKTAETAKKRQETIQQFANKTSEYFIKKSNEKIAQIDKEIAAAQKQSETLKALAESGNINAQQSLAENQRIIDQANLRKEKQLKKQQRIEAGLAIFKLFSANADKKNPLAATIKDTTGLLAFISSLPMFYDGTEDTGSNGQGIDGKGGFHAVLHPNERVLPKSLNEQIGSMSNEQLTKIAQEYQNGRLVSKSNSNSGLEMAILVNEMRDLKEVIKNKPETNIALGEITQSAMNIVESKRTGNTTVYNRFRISK